MEGVKNNIFLFTEIKRKTKIYSLLAKSSYKPILNFLLNLFSLTVETVGDKK